MQEVDWCVGSVNTVFKVVERGVVVLVLVLYFVLSGCEQT